MDSLGWWRRLLARSPTWGLAGLLTLTALFATPSLRAQRTASGPGVPGALPRGFVYEYNDTYHGWPIAPVHEQHPVRSSFLDPRGFDENGLAGYHFGIDISVNDRHPDPGAPGLFSHRVYAVENGLTDVRKGVDSAPCADRRLGVGHFAYWHVSPIVPSAHRVRAGQQIGWTCRGEWHVHLSEWQLFRGTRVWVNPLHRSGGVRPYTDTAPPIVSRLRFVTPSATPWQPTSSLSEADSAIPLPASGLHGRVELRARVDDPQSFLGFLAHNPTWPTLWSPYALRVVIRDMRTGRIVMQRTTFRVDQLPQTPYLVHYAPGTVEDNNMNECVGPPPLKDCDGITWLRPFSRFHLEDWDTRRVVNGTYRVTVDGFDIAGNVGSKTIVVGVRN